MALFGDMYKQVSTFQGGRSCSVAIQQNGLTNR